MPLVTTQRTFFPHRFIIVIIIKNGLFSPVQVGVHNGWTYIEKPQVFNLDVLTGQGGGSVVGGDVSVRKTTASPSMRRSSRFHIRRNSMSSM